MQSQVIPMPLHNIDGTIRSQARQMLADLDRNALTTAVPTATLEMLLNRLCEALDDPVPHRVPAVRSMLTEAAEMPRSPLTNPNMQFWRGMAEKDEDNA
jgi:hypothetical protein